MRAIITISLLGILISGCYPIWQVRKDYIEKSTKVMFINTDSTSAFNYCVYNRFNTPIFCITYKSKENSLVLKNNSSDEFIEIDSSFTVNYYNSNNDSSRSFNKRTNKFYISNSHYDTRNKIFGFYLVVKRFKYYISIRYHGDMGLIRSRSGESYGPLYSMYKDHIYIQAVFKKGRLMVLYNYLF